MLSNNIKIKSIRLGHANNSSSSHSIVFLGDTKKEDSYLEEDDYSFGWEYWTASTRKSKEAYFLLTLYLNLYGINDLTKKRPLIEKIIKNNDDERYQEGTKSYKKNQEDKKITQKYCCRLVNEKFQDIFTESNLNNLLEQAAGESYDYNIDHQSVINLPSDKYKELDLNFSKNLFKILLDNNFAILGGNDNGGNYHPLKRIHIKNKFSDNILTILDFIGTERSSYQVVSYYDKLNDDFIIQDRYNGNKLRFSFDVNSDDTTKSKFPELVDLKITSFCNYGCNFCYMSSTEEGKHGDLNDLKRIIDMLHESNCMEIAIGGGEPTSHPNFVEILRYINSKNILVGFTTKNWNLYQHKDFKYILKYTNSIAFSCQTPVEIEKVLKIQEEAKIIIQNNRDFFSSDETCYPTKFYIQTILELSSLEHLEKIFKVCQEKYFPLTLLGYKHFGFGEKYKAKNLDISDEWIDLVKKHKNLQVGIDSVIVKKWKEKLIEKGVDKRMLIGEEGKFSCFIDGVEKKISKSSFVKEQEELDMESNDILKQFKKF